MKVNGTTKLTQIIHKRKMKKYFGTFGKQNCKDLKQKKLCFTCMNLIWSHFCNTLLKREKKENSL